MLVTVCGPAEVRSVTEAVSFMVRLAPPRARKIRVPRRESRNHRLIAVDARVEHSLSHPPPGVRKGLQVRGSSHLVRRCCQRARLALA